MKAPVVPRASYKKPFVEHVATPSRNMAGKGAPRSTVFGVLGETKIEDPYHRILGGLVVDSKTSAPIQPGTLVSDTKSLQTERHIVGPISKTSVPGTSYGQVPYAGRFMTEKGHALS